jgi:hypothetical protein
MSPPGFQPTLPHAVSLIIVCAVAVSLLFTPGAPLVVAIAIVIPGFLIDRMMGRTGIIGGTMSSSILAVILGGLHVYSSADGSFGDVLAAFPALYFIFVVSLRWGGVASMTLYWVIKACRERRSRSPAMGNSRIQFTLGQLLGVVVVCAIVFAALSTPFAIFVVAIGIVAPGFIIDRFRGGTGIVGGMISASIVLVGLGIAGYTYFYLNPDPEILAYLGPPPLTLFMLGTAGVAWGALAGTVMDVIIIIKNSYKIEHPIIDESCPLIVWLPDETRGS